VHASRANFNTEIGLPLEVLAAPDGTEVLVLEMGMRGLGEIARLCAVARPTIGVVTTVAEAHSELLGGIEGVVRAKGELVEALPADGTAILNGAQPLVMALRSRTAASVLTFGSEDADVRAEHVRLDRLARPAFTLVTPDGRVEVALAVSGDHMVGNACAAAALGVVLGVSLGGIAAGLSTAVLSPWRMEISVAPSGAVVINDAYNANPTSMRAALDALAAVPARRRVAALGVMAEIADAEEEHMAIAAYAAERGIELVPIGTDLYGMPSAGDATAVAVSIIGSITGDDAVLVKGSRVAGLERLAARLLA
jgi:UDP-N-acetylmuramoyl-tripeptide--D-alanyl-D-alanine ligase